MRAFGALVKYWLLFLANIFIKFAAFRNFKTGNMR